MTSLFILKEKLFFLGRQEMQEPLTFPQTVFSKPQYNRRQALPLIRDEEQAVELKQECDMFLFSGRFTYKSGFPLLYMIYSERPGKKLRKKLHKGGMTKVKLRPR